MNIKELFDLASTSKLKKNTNLILVLLMIMMQKVV